MKEHLINSLSPRTRKTLYLSDLPGRFIRQRAEGGGGFFGRSRSASSLTTARRAASSGHVDLPKYNVARYMPAFSFGRAAAARLPFGFLAGADLHRRTLVCQYAPANRKVTRATSAYLVTRRIRLAWRFSADCKLNASRLHASVAYLSFKNTQKAPFLVPPLQF